MIDWFNGPTEGFLTPMLEPPASELREQASGGPAAIPEVQFGKAHEQINPTTRDLRFIVPLTDGAVYLGDVNLTVSPRDELSVDAERFLQMLRPVLKPEVYTRLASSVDAGRLNEIALGRDGIRLHYDPRTLALSIEIPVNLRLTRSYSLGAKQDFTSESLQPAGVSAYLNVHAAADLVELGPSAGFQPPSASLDAAVRIHGIVGEFEGYTSARRGDPIFRRTGTRLVFDDPGHAMRWTLGDTQVQAEQFQASPAIFGLGVARLYRQIDPQREIRASGAQSFSVLDQSVVETFVNGRSVERRSVQPGSYTLQDFPLADGANRVKLQIQDASGKIRQIDFSVYANQALLGKGVTEFSAFAGVYAEPTRAGLAYSRRWVGGGFARRGLSEQVTAGVNFQANARVRQVGADVLWGSPAGLASFSLSGSNSARRGNGLAAALTFERLLSYQGNARSQSVRASLEWRSKRFDIPDVQFGLERSELRASAGYVVTLRENSFLAADLDYARDRTSSAASYGGRLSGGWDVGRLAATAEVGFTRGLPRHDNYVRLGLRMRFGQRGTIQFDAASNGQARINVSDSGGSGNGAWFGSADLSRDRNSVSLNANGNLLTNRAELGVQQTAGWQHQGMKLTDARTTLRAAFGLAMADGLVAVGRPVTDAFVIAKPHRTLAGKPVYLDPVGASETARADHLGPALDGQLSAYNVRTLTYQVPGAPSGYDLGAGNISIRPPYRAGYKLIIGSDYHLLALGRLLDVHGEPISLLAGRAIDLGNPKRPALTVFTARDGRFGAQGLRPGRWRIEMPTDKPTTFEFELQDSPDGTVRLGDLHPLNPERKKP